MIHMLGSNMNPHEAQLYPSMMDRLGMILTFPCKGMIPPSNCHINSSSTMLTTTLTTLTIEIIRESNLHFRSSLRMRPSIADTSGACNNGDTIVFPKNE